MLFAYELSTIDPRLFLTNVGFIFSSILTLALGVFVLYKNPRKETNIVFFLFSISVAVFEISHIVGINLVDPYVSWFVLMFNLSTLFTAVLVTHTAFSLFNTHAASRRILKALYIICFSLVGFFLFNPHTFLEPSIPKLYFPNYYAPGEWYFIGDIFYYGAILYCFSVLFVTYRRADWQTRNRMKYFIAGIAFGFVVGAIAALPLYDYPVDPLVSLLLGLYTIPLAYGIVRADLMDIHVIAKRAVIYSFVTIVVSLLIVAINAGNSWISETIPSFPNWLIPFVSSILGVTAGAIIWRKMREVDTLKYEFINVVTHKFRTPLTYIKWSTENLRKASTETERTTALSNIENATVRLSELTEALVTTEPNVSFAPPKSLYAFDEVARVSDTFKSRIAEQGMSMALENNGDALVAIDKNRFKSAIEIVIENAIQYGKKGGHIAIGSSVEKRVITIRISDNGIGIPPEELPFIFNTFYRSKSAMLKDTEGIGLGLFVTKNIIESFGGKMWVESPGVDKGSTFFIRLPIAKDGQREN